MRFWLARMDDIRKSDRILYEKDWNVITHNIPVPFLGVELHRKTTNVSDRVCATTATQNSGETKKHWSLSICIRQDAS